MRFRKLFNIMNSLLECARHFMFVCAQSTFIHFRNVNRQNSTNYEKSNILGHIGMPNNVSKCVFAISLHIVRPSHHLVPVDIHCSTSCCVRYILYIFFLCWLEYFSIVFGCCCSPTTINFPALSCSFFTIFCLFWFLHYAPSHRDKVDIFPTLPSFVFKMCDTKCVSNIFPTARKPIVRRQWKNFWLF